jgi:Tol biopolymer transport system component
LTFEKGASEPTWTPDGKRVAYDTIRAIGTGQQAGSIYWKAADGSGDAEALISGAAAVYIDSFSEDGRFVIFERTEPGTSQSHLWYMALDGERKPLQLTSGEFAQFQAKLSPDGRWLAYNSNESGRIEVFVRPFPASGGKWQISASGGIEPNWSRDGRELLFRSAGGLRRVSIDTASGFSAGRPELVATGFRSGDNPRSYSPTPDGQRFAALPSWEMDRTVLQVDLALHWDREVKRLLEGKR